MCGLVYMRGFFNLRHANAFVCERIDDRRENCDEDENEDRVEDLHLFG